MKIIPFSEEHIPSTVKAADQYIGANYFDSESLKDVLKRSQLKGQNASFLLVDESSEVKGFRLTYPQGNWLDLKGPEETHPHLWKVPSEKVAYFQSLFLAPEVRGKSWGGQLSQASLGVLKELGAEAVVCHSWKESPRNSSMRYLEKLGFEVVTEIPNYWIEVDYHCVRCGKPCLCTATEMVFYL